MTAHSHTEFDPNCFRCDLSADENWESSAVSAQYPRECPTCKARPFSPCRTLSTGRVTDTHVSRLHR